MKNIKITPKKLDAAADEYFSTVRYHENNPEKPVTIDYLEKSMLAGMALRRWAAQIRDEREAARQAKANDLSSAT